MSFSKMKLGNRLALGFGAILLLLLAVAGTGYWGTTSLSKTFQNVLSTDATIATHSERARANVLGMRRYEKDIYLNIESKQKIEDYLKQWKQQHEHFLARIKDLEAASTSQHDKDTVRTMQTEFSAYVSGFNKVYEMIQAGKVKTPQEGNQAINEYKDAIHKLEKTAIDFAEEGVKRMAESGQTARVIADRISLTVMILALVSAIFGIGASFIITRSITKPLRRVVEGLDEAAGQVASASGQVSTAGQVLAEGASEQAASIEETSSSLEEMASMTKQNADNAMQANQMMSETRATLTRAGQSMGYLTTSMGEISRASEETSKIIKTIDEIAFQTNLLALNAAVEEARAGESGAGFAVVADEVRNLAMRAAEAAKNTASLIEGTVKKVKEGSQLVEKTEKEFVEVASSVGKSAELVAEISSASNEQAQGIAQVSTAVSEMDKVVQQNSASAEETASASEELSGQASQMQEYVGDLIALVGSKEKNRAAHASKPGLRHVSQTAKPLAGSFGKRNGKSKRPAVAPAEDLIPFENERAVDF